MRFKFAHTRIKKKKFHYRYIRAEERKGWNLGILHDSDPNRDFGLLRFYTFTIPISFSFLSLSFFFLFFCMVKAHANRSLRFNKLQSMGADQLDLDTTFDKFRESIRRSSIYILFHLFSNILKINYLMF